VSRVDREPCYILHRRAYRESSLTIELYSLNYGRLGAVARAARSNKSSFRGITEPFVPLQASWVRRGEMATLTALDRTDRNTSRYTRNAVWCGLYINELLMRLLARDDPEPVLYHCYADSLQRLYGSEHQASILRRFELELLRAIGVAPDLVICSDNGKPVSPESYYRFDPAAGPVEAPASTSDAVSGATLLNLDQQIPLSNEQAREAKRLLRSLIDQQLDGRPLQTPMVFRRLV